MNPAPTIAPDAQPVDVIVQYLSTGDSVPVELWKYCVSQWAYNDYAFDPENYFRLQDAPLVEPEISDAADIDDIDGDDSDPVFDPEEDTSSDLPLSPEVQEQLVIYAPLIAALKTFWTDLMIFTEDMPTVQQWPTLMEAVERYIAFQPVDPERLVRHVRRINAARQEAESLKPKTPVIAQNTVLFDILNNKFD